MAGLDGSADREKEKQGGNAEGRRRRPGSVNQNTCQL